MPAKPNPMPLSQVAATPEFRRLNAKNAQWVLLYLQSYLDTGIFNHIAATRAVYPSAIPVRVRATASRLLHCPKVRAVVGVFLDAGTTELDRDLDEIQRAIDAADPGGIAMQRLVVLKMRLKYGLRGGLKKAAEPAAEIPTPKPDATPAPKVWTVGQRIRQRRADGTIRRGVVTAVDATGKPTIEEEPRE